MMDAAGIDAAFLTSAPGMCASLEVSKLCNDKAKKAEKDYPGRFIAAAHAHPLGGADAHARAQPLRAGARLPGVVITSEMDGKFIDDPALEPFWTEAEKLGLFVFVHPALKLNFSQQFDGYDTARSVGREFSLVMATIRLINSGVFDRHPKLHRAHVASRRRHRRRAGARPRLPGQGFLGRQGQRQARPQGREGFRPLHQPQHGVRHRGFCCAIGAVNAALAEIPASRIVFATDYPQEVRKREPVRDFVQDIRKLGKPGEQILSGNVGLLMKGK